MDNEIMEQLEVLEDRVENIKWLITTSYLLKKAGISEVINAIRRSAGIFGKDFPRGTVFENKVRREWGSNLLKRIG